MRLALISDTFPPLRTSGAVQMRDLALEFVRQGHPVTVLLPDSDQRQPWVMDVVDGVEVLRLRTPRMKDVGYLRRTIGEAIMPFAMRRGLRGSPLAEVRWDGVVWYSPSIFHGPLVSAMKGQSRCKAYLMVRDVFPEWALDLGLMGRGLPYAFFRAVARYQYSVADIIGVQTAGNLGYFDHWREGSGRKLEILHNWLGPPGRARSPVRVAETGLAGRKVLVYAGNMGLAQGLDIFVELADRLRDRSDIGFLFVGRGSDKRRLESLAKQRRLDNMVFRDEIHPDEIPDLYSQCSAGLLSLDARHKTHNIPGKFLTYMQNRLPVLASVNLGNDLARVIRDERVGKVCESSSVDRLLSQLEALLQAVGSDEGLPERCGRLFERRFSVAYAVQQILSALTDRSMD